MTEQDLLKRITATPEIRSGQPIIRGMRISVELVLSVLAQYSWVGQAREGKSVPACSRCLKVRPHGAGTSWTHHH